MAGPVGEWHQHAGDIHGFLLDVYGVLYDSGPGGSVAIEGSIEAVQKLRASGVPIRFCTNGSLKTTDELSQSLVHLGYSGFQASEVFSPLSAVHHYLQQNHLRPLLIVHDAVLGTFDDIDQSDPNCVVLGDAQDNFRYEKLNRAFQVLIGLQKPLLIAMGTGKFYHETDGMKLDMGVFAKALQYACDIEEPEVIGKPAKSFFMAAVDDMGLSPNHVVMIGDDIISDVGGAQACGMRGVQVRTGKYRPNFEPHPTVRPDGYVDNLLQAVDLYLQRKDQC